ncbi:MAG: quinonprotein alcohol dehydrogenase [Gemmataceae bacterium]|nr:quinonprotein alcohol dehydrogenase [Gemmataceae bacterium]
MPMRFTLLASLIVALSVLADDNWPEFRGPKADGHSDAKRLPLTWSDTQNVRWKTAIHDKGWSSPVIWANQVWVTTATEKGDKCYAVALDRDSGKIIHDLLLFEVSRPNPEDVYYKWKAFNSYASPTPVIEQGRVYVHFGVSGTACLDTATGKVLWQRTDLECDHHRGAGSSPILHGDHLFLTFDGFDLQYVIALNKNTGKTVWKRDRKFHEPKENGDIKKAYSTPLMITVNDKPLLVSPSAGATAAYDPQTGDEVWRVVHGGMNASLRPLFGNGKLFTSSSDGGLNLVAVRPDGKGNITKTHIDWTFGKGVPNRSSFLLVGDQLLMVNSGGVTTCVSVKDGKELGKSRVDTKGKFWGSPIVAEGKWYAFDDEGNGFVISADEKLEVLGSSKLPSGSRSSPAAVGNAIYHRTFTHLYRFEEKK